MGTTAIKQVGRDQPVAQPPDGLAHAAPRQPEQRQRREDEGSQRRQQLDGGRHAREVQQRVKHRENEKGFLDPAEPPPNRFEAFPHRYPYRLAHRNPRR